MVDFDYGSDIHLDFHSTIEWGKFKKRSPILILAGDSSNKTLYSSAALSRAKEFYKHVLYVDGNHDHYNGAPVSQNLSDLAMWAKQDGATFLPKQDLIVDDTAFIGLNGWYDFNASDTISQSDQRAAWQRCIADSRLIDFEGSSPDRLAKDHAAALRAKVNEYDEDPKINSIVIVTHVPPSRTFRIVRDGDHTWNCLNGTFYNSEMEKVHGKHKKIKAWVCGHTHFKYDFEENGVRFLCNPKGYPGEGNCLNWKPIKFSV